MRLISAERERVAAWIHHVDLSSFTRTAGFTVSNPCRTASPKQTRSTFTPRFAVERESSFASRSRNRATSLACSVGKVALAFRVAEKPGEAFDYALVTRVRGFLSLDCLRFAATFRTTI